MEHFLSIEDVKEKKIFDLGEDFSETNSLGQKLGFTNYYIEKDGKPFYGISGEIHFSRCDASRWEDELIKMKMAGINVISTYIFWIHHEEEEGIFDFSGNKDLKRFVSLCKKHGLYVILRVGPFDHGEVRNGGIPDWMYGKPFEVRHLNEGFLFYTKRLYSRLGEEVSGLFFQDGGPIIGVQIDNEYMHSSAPWEMTTGISNEWVFVGSQGDEYMLRLKELAAECGLTPVFYTCTAWGGAATPDNMMPLWGGYAYRPWLFYSYKGDHPSTEEYVYQDFHNNNNPSCHDFDPKYKPEDKPYACCEMGGGMNCSYNYRFTLPFKSIDAMANIKMASGCNFLGYYMFHGGSNPLGKHGTFLNEGQMPKISYDYQAALGEFGQIRESYQRLKTIHFFARTFQEELCGLKTVLPEGASQIQPKDLTTLRYALRTDGERGFVFINNFQDHEVMPDKKDEIITLKLKDETITFPSISIAGDENCILPFHLNLQGADLITATAQPVTYIEEEKLYVFMRPEGMVSEFRFAEGIKVGERESNVYVMNPDHEAEIFKVSGGATEFKILCVSRKMADQMYQLEGKGLIFTDAALLVSDESIRIETRNNKNTLLTYPASLLDNSKFVQKKDECTQASLGCYEAVCEKIRIEATYEQVADHRYVVKLPEICTSKLTDVMLKIDYAGDIGHAFIDGQLINDNFCNGDTWEIGLRNFTERLKENPLTIYITPLKEGVNVNVESTMAARMEEVESTTGALKHVAVDPVYQLQIM